jgi:hypothetical protein
MTRACTVSSMLGVLTLLACAIPPRAAAAAPTCPTLVESSPDRDRPTVVRLTARGACPLPDMLSVEVTSITGESLARRTVPAAAGAIRQFELDLATVRPQSALSGVYRLRWSAVTPSGPIARDHLFTVGCPPPPSATPRLAGTPARVELDLPPGDACQGENVAVLEWLDDAGAVLGRSPPGRLPATVGGRLSLAVDPALAAKASAARVALRNATPQPRVLPLPLPGRDTPTAPAPAPVRAAAAACPAPAVEALALEVADDAVALVGRSRLEPCHRSAELLLQLRDPEGAIVFNRTLAPAPSGAFRVPVTVVSGTAYAATATLNHGDPPTTVVAESKVVAACDQPRMLDAGFATADAAALTARLRLAACHLPASARVVVRDSAGALVASAQPTVQPADGEARLEPLPIGDLPAGGYTATFEVRDAQGRTATRTLPFTHDSAGPTLAFRVRGAPVVPGVPLVIGGLGDLQVVSSDPSGPLSAAEPVATRPAAAAGLTAAIDALEGERGTELVITGAVGRPGPDAQVTAVLIQGAGRLWRVPVVRRVVADERAAPFGPHAVGFRAAARTAGLDGGSYRVEGVVVATPGSERLVPASGSFLLGAPGERRTHATLRQGLLDIPVDVRFEPDGRGWVAARGALIDGDYTLELIDHDRFGNASTPQRLVFTVAQDKDTRIVSLPLLPGHSTTIEHRFVGTDPGAPLRLLARRSSGSGAVQLGDRRVEGQTVELHLRADPRGLVRLPMSTVGGPVDGRITLQPDVVGARALELAVTTYAPDFALRRQEAASGTVLLIENRSAACARYAVVTTPTAIAASPGEAVCALKVSAPGAVVLSTTPQHTALSLPSLDPSTLLIESGFIVGPPGASEFRTVATTTLAELEALSLAPRVAFEPVSALRGRAGALLTRVGPFRPGELVVHAEAEGAVIEVGGRRLALDRAGVHRLPVETQVASVGATQTITVRAFYAATPSRVTQTELRFVGVPPAIEVEPVASRLVLPEPLSVDLRLTTEDGAYAAARHGALRVREAFLLRTRDASARPESVVATSRPDGAWRMALPVVSAGAYRLYLAFEATDPALAAVQPPLSVTLPLAVHDGRPLEASLFTFRASGAAPFVGRAQLKFARADGAADLATAAWEISSDGKVFTPYQSAGSAVDVAIPTPGSRWLRARLVNRHSGTDTVTAPVTLSAFAATTLSIDGPTQTFRGFPVTLTATTERPDGVLWRIGAPGTDRVQEIRAGAITLTPRATGTYYVEAIADAAVAGPGARAAPRVFRTVTVHWPTVPPAIVQGPREVETGRPATFTVRHPPLFARGGNDALTRAGEWVLPDGRVIPGAAPLVYTLEAPPPGQDGVDLVYRAWIDGARAATLSTTTHRLRPVSYRWPEWQLKAETVSTGLPAVHRVSLQPTVWRDWLALGEGQLDTAWQLPPFARLRHQSAREVVFEVLHDRPFDVAARVTDARGNTAQLTLAAVEPVQRTQFAIAARVTAERVTRTAPLKVAVGMDPVLLPKGGTVSRVAYYLNDEYQGATTGAPLQVLIPRSGVHTLRAVASIGTQFVAQDSVSIELAENLPPVCSIRAVGDFAINGVATAECDDPDGTMKAYRWYLNGQLVTGTGSRLVVPRAQLSDVEELSVVGVDSAGREATARFAPVTAGS